MGLGLDRLALVALLEELHTNPTIYLNCAERFAIGLAVSEDLVTIGTKEKQAVKHSFNTNAGA